MTFRHASLFSVVVILSALLTFRSTRETKPKTILQLQSTPTSVLKVSTPVAEKLRQPLFQANADGSFSTKHPEISPDSISRWSNPAKPVDVDFPRCFSEPVVVKSEGTVVQCLPLNGNPDSQPELMDGKTLIYRNAFPGCDVKYRSSIHKTEEFIVVKDASALDEEGKITWSWELKSQYEGKVLTPRLTPIHTIELVDELGLPRLRIDAPFGMDATGSAILAGKQLKFVVEGSQLTMLLDCAGLQLPLEIDPSWSSTGTMSIARATHSATLTTQGKVIVAGGFTDPNSLTNTTEQFDPVNKIWSSANSLTEARWGHSSIALPNGKIMIAGGIGGVSNTTLSSIEIYDPSANSWSLAAGTLITPRVLHSATLLPNGKVLLAGGGQAGTATLLGSAEIFDPSTGMCTAAASMTPRIAHTETLLASGLVLVGGGESSSFQLFDYQNNIWTSTSPLNQPAVSFSAQLLPDNRVLIAGGASNSNTVSEIYDSVQDVWSLSGGLSPVTPYPSLALLPNGRVFSFRELNSGSTHTFNSSSGVWTSSATLIEAVSESAGCSLSNGSVLITGGSTGSIKTGNCYIYSPVPIASNLTAQTHFSTPTSISLSTDSLDDSFSIAIATSPQHGQLSGTGTNRTYTPDALYVGSDTFTYTVTDSLGTSPAATISISVTNSAPLAATQSVSVHSGTAIPITLSATDAESDPTTFTVLTAPTHGTLSGVAPNLTYTAATDYFGADSFTFSASDAVAVGNTATITIAITNQAPQISLAATPINAVAGQSVSFSSLVTDPEGDAVFYKWSFDDGGEATGANPTHTFSLPALYRVKLTVTDTAGGTNTQLISISVFNPSDKPVARFTTSDVVGFVGLPILFDAAYSSDPQNALDTFSWNFGDGSPIGSGQTISRTYNLSGTYTVKLTVTDEQGLQGIALRLIEILPADQIGLFNAFVEIKTAFDRSKTAKDTIALKAQLNVGDSQIGDGSVMALEIAGQRFEATLDRKLRATVKTTPKQTWKVQFATRKQSAGQVDVQVTIKNADLGLGFNQLGAVAGGDDSATVTVPIRLEVGEYSFEVPCEVDFDFNKAGTKAKGEGASE